MRPSIESTLLRLASGEGSLDELTRWLGHNSVNILKSGSMLEKQIVGELENLLVNAQASGDLLPLMDAARRMLSDRTEHRRFRVHTSVELITGHESPTVTTGTSDVTRRATNVSAGVL